MCYWAFAGWQIIGMYKGYFVFPSEECSRFEVILQKYHVALHIDGSQYCEHLYNLMEFSIEVLPRLIQKRNKLLIGGIFKPIVVFHLTCLRVRLVVGLDQVWITLPPQMNCTRISLRPDWDDFLWRVLVPTNDSYQGGIQTRVQFNWTKRQFHCGLLVPLLPHIWTTFPINPVACFYPFGSLVSYFTKKNKHVGSEFIFALVIICDCQKVWKL